MKATRSACICFVVCFCLRDLLASCRSQPVSFSANGSSFRIGLYSVNVPVEVFYDRLLAHQA